MVESMSHASRSAASDSQVPVNLPPKRRIEAAVKRYGEWEVVDRSISLIAGNNEGEDFLLYVGGDHAQGILDGAPALYWPELWGLRSLLYVWDKTAESSVIRALHNSAWRVREMAARVTAERELPAAVELRKLLADRTPRVRIAAARALAVVGSTEDIEQIEAQLKDPEIEVRRAASQSLEALRTRLP